MRWMWYAQWNLVNLDNVGARQQVGAALQHLQQPRAMVRMLVRYVDRHQALGVGAG